MARKRQRWGSVLLSIAVLVCIGYCLAGYLYLRHLDTFRLVYYAIFPTDIAPAWRLVPGVGPLANTILERRSTEKLREPFHRLPITLYSVALGYSKVYPRHLTQDQEERARNLTKLLHDAGVPVGAALVDSVGCSAVHQALIDNNVAAANFLLSLGDLKDVPGNPRARLRGCREDAVSLAKSRGIALK